MSYIVLDIVLSVLVVAGVVGLLAWSVMTQHRHPGCESLRIGRRLRVSVKLVRLDRPAPPARAPFEAPRA